MGESKATDPINVEDIDYANDPLPVSVALITDQNTDVRSRIPCRHLTAAVMKARK